jgi:hypothetical protein
MTWSRKSHHAHEWYSFNDGIVEVPINNISTWHWEPSLGGARFVAIAALTYQGPMWPHTRTE